MPAWAWATPGWPSRGRPADRGTVWRSFRLTDSFPQKYVLTAKRCWWRPGALLNFLYLHKGGELPRFACTLDSNGDRTSSELVKLVHAVLSHRNYHLTRCRFVGYSITQQILITHYSDRHVPKSHSYRQHRPGSKHASRNIDHNYLCYRISTCKSYTQ